MIDIDTLFMVCRKRLYKNKKVVLAIPKELFLATRSKKISFEMNWSMSINLKRYQVTDIEAVFMVCRKRPHENTKAILAIPKELFSGTHSKKISPQQDMYLYKNVLTYS